MDSIRFSNTAHPVFFQSCKRALFPRLCAIDCSVIFTENFLPRRYIKTLDYGDHQLHMRGNGLYICPIKKSHASVKGCVFLSTIL
ncbi:hypothetical protein FKM82_013942 [Ascaphus truei]